MQDLAKVKNYFSNIESKDWERDKIFGAALYCVQVLNLADKNWCAKTFDGFKSSLCLGVNILSYKAKERKEAKLRNYF